MTGPRFFGLATALTLAAGAALAHGDVAPQAIRNSFLPSGRFNSCAVVQPVSKMQISISFFMRPNPVAEGWHYSVLLETPQCVSPKTQARSAYF